MQLYSAVFCTILVNDRISVLKTKIEYCCFFVRFVKLSLLFTTIFYEKFK